jgi:hypothetical protein
MICRTSSPASDTTSAGVTVGVSDLFGVAGNRLLDRVELLVAD